MRSNPQPPPGPSPGADELVARNLDLVSRVVARTAVAYPRHVDRDELWNAGALGLVEAARRFDPAAGVDFRRYAMIRIRGAIVDSTRSRDWASRAVRRAGRELDGAERRLWDRLGRRPSTAELAGEMGVTPAEVDAVRSRTAAAGVVSLDQTRPGDDSSPGDSLAGSDPWADPETMLERAELVGMLRTAVAALAPTLRSVVVRSYLLGDLLQDIAADLGVTEARVSQLRAEALDCLRAWFGEMYRGVPAVADDAPGKRARAAFLARLAERSAWRTRLEEPAPAYPAAAGE